MAETAVFPRRVSRDAGKSAASVLIIDDEMAILPDPFLGVVLDPDVLIFLGVHEDLFAAFFVFETEFIERSRRQTPPDLILTEIAVDLN